MNLKELYEKRNNLIKSLEDIINKATTEKRAMTEEENTKYDADMKEINALNQTVEKALEARGLDKTNPDGGKVSDDAKKIELDETRAFDAFVRNIENRAATHLTTSSNGNEIPKTIVNKIITEIKEISPIAKLCQFYNINGKLVFPKYGKDSSSNNVTVAFATEFTALTSNAGAFSTVELGGYLVGALTKVSMSLIDNVDFDVVSFIVGYMAQKIADFIEKEALIGTSGKTTGLLSTSTTLATAVATAITMDELIELQAKIKQPYQKNAIWIMHPSVFLAIKKLKDSDGKYHLNDDLTSGFSYSLLGKPVYLSENMESSIAGSKKTVLYGDMSGFAIKLTKGIDIQIMREKFLDEHALGVVGWFEMDCNLLDAQKIACLIQKAAS